MLYFIDKHNKNKNHTMKSIDLSYHLLDNYSSQFNITPLKLQKLLYYVYVWGIVSGNEIVKDDFVKWEHGPVNVETYYNYKEFGGSGIKNSKKNYPDLSISEIEFIDFIVSNYIKFSAYTLSSMTHQDLPWKETQKDEIIAPASILKFYSTLNFAKNFPIDFNKPFYPVETDLHYSFIFDFSENDNSSGCNYKNYKEYLKLSEKTSQEFKQHFNDW